MQFHIKYLSVFILLSIYSCGDFWASNYDFETTATYIAPKTKVTVVVSTKGYVPKGADLGDENECLIIAKIIFDYKPTDTVKVISTGFKVVSTTIKDSSFQFSDSSNYTSILIDCAHNIGIAKVDSIELAELSQVIMSTCAGPKGTFLKGQTKDIIVDTVSYITKDR